MNKRQISLLTNRNFWLILMFMCFMLLLAGCGGSAERVSPTPVPARDTETPLPSSTPTILPSSTPTSTATPDKTQTVAALAASEMQEKLDEIAPELDKLGYDLDSGALVYYRSAPSKIIVDSYMENKPDLIVDEPVSNFIMQVDIGWNSTSGLAGCGIVFRAEEDLENGAFYEYVMLRLSGAPAWDLGYYRYGQFQYSLLPAAQFTAAIDERQDAVNTVTLIVEGDTIESVINTTKSMDAMDKKLSEGRIGLLGWQESGKTICTFSNVWVWELNP